MVMIFRVFVAVIDYQKIPDQTIAYTVVDIQLPVPPLIV